MAATVTLTDPNGKYVGTPGGGSSATAPTATGSYQQLSIPASSTALTKPADATKATVRVSAQAVRWRSDGVAPTAAIGMPAAVGETLTFYGAEISAVRFIQQAATPVLDIYYSK